MKHISILIPELDCSVAHIDATHQIFSEINVLLASKNKSPLFEIQLVGLHNESGIKKGMFNVKPDVLIADVKKTDLIIIPALQGGDMVASLKANNDFIPWIVQQYSLGSEVASLCIGSFLLAATGLLDSKKCTTHWSAVNLFAEMFPQVELVPDKILTDEGGIYSSGGALSFSNLIIYLVEKYAGRDMAVLSSKIFMIDIDRHTQSPFMIFKTQKEHDDEPVKKAQDFIEKNFAERLTIDELAGMLALGRRNLERRFKKATSNTLVEYIQRVRIEAAKLSLESSRENINEVMYKVGYNDNKAFRMTFKKITGLSPVQYRSKYNRETIYDKETA